ncbi:MAG: ATP-binding protein [Planctomyces sp.]
MPEAALREAVLNAIIHKDYATGTPVQISVYAYKLMIWNPDQLPPSWTLAKLRQKHASLPFNPVIANVFFRAGEIEAWGRGVERIFAACREARFPEPVIEQESTGLWISLAFPEDIVKRTAESDSGKKFGRGAGAILKMIEGNPRISAQEMVDSLTISERAIEKNLRSLREQGVIRRIGPVSHVRGAWDLRAY